MIFTGRRAAIQQARALLEKHPIYLDTETTGIGPQAEIVEIAIVDANGIVLLDRLVKPKGKMEPEAERLHGISKEMLMDAPTWPDIWAEVQPILEGHKVGAYNSDFDLRMMRQSHQKYWMPWKVDEENFFCVMKLYARFYGLFDPKRGYVWHTLDQAGRQSGIALPNKHRAKDDALLTRALMNFMANSDNGSTIVK